MLPSPIRMKTIYKLVQPSNCRNKGPGYTSQKFYPGKTKIDEIKKQLQEEEPDYTPDQTLMRIVTLLLDFP